MGEFLKYITNTNSGNTDIIPFISLALIAICTLKSSRVPSVKHFKKTYENEEEAKRLIEREKEKNRYHEPFGW